MIRPIGELHLILPCEVAAKSVVPAVRALIAKELMDEQGLKQDEVAEILGISQSAVSKYSRKVRGRALKVEDVAEVRPFISGMVTVLLDQTTQRTELLSLFCQACIVIRSTSLMCIFCKKSDPKIDIEACGFCMTLKSDEDER